MCEARQELHGDPEAMRRFAARLAALGTPGAAVEPPGASACEDGMQACATFAAADAVATLALAQFLAETGDAITSLTEAAAVAAEDYQASDRAGARAVAGLVLGVVTLEG